MKAEMIQEFQLLQQSRSNKFAGELAERVISSVEAVNEKVTNSLSQRGKMLMLLEEKLNFSILKKFKNRFLNF